MILQVQIQSIVTAESLDQASRDCFDLAETALERWLVTGDKASRGQFVYYHEEGMKLSFEVERRAAFFNDWRSKNGY